VFLIANVVDDIEMRISHVLRAEEHLPNTPKQQMLWEALGHAPPAWAHVPVLVNEQRKKLSKRRDKVALESYREEGFLADAIVNYLMTLGWAPKGESEIVPWSEIEHQFRLEDVTHSPAFFDLKKLSAFNGEYIRALPVTRFVHECEPWLARWREAHPSAEWDDGVFAAMAPLVQTRIVTLAEAPAMVDFLFLAEPEMDERSVAKAFGAPDAGAILADVIESYESCEWTADALKESFEKLAEQRGQKVGKAQAPVRVAVTGRSVGPPLFESLEHLGRERTLARLRAAAGRARADAAV
jgi:glutamyl-tRNA synthetase